MSGVAFDKEALDKGPGACMVSADSVGPAGAARGRRRASGARDARSRIDCNAAARGLGLGVVEPARWLSRGPGAPQAEQPPFAADVPEDAMPADLFWNRHWPLLAAEGWRIECTEAGKPRFFSPPAAGYAPVAFDSYQEVIAHLTTNSDHSNNSVEQMSMAMPRRQAPKHDQQQAAKLRTFPEPRRAGSGGKNQQVKVDNRSRRARDRAPARPRSGPGPCVHARAPTNPPAPRRRCAPTAAPRRPPCGARPPAS
jgi:hypothetical protein